MPRLEDLTPGTMVKGLAPGDTSVRVVQIEFFGPQAAKVYYENAAGKPGQRLLYRTDEASLIVSENSRNWAFDGDGDLFRLVSEALRLQLAHLFDPYLAISTALVDPLPHQITAVYEKMLPMQPLRYLLADDPGAGKTIMTGLLLRELIMRGDLERCLIVPPGNLVEQWQDELAQKFGIHFSIFTKSQMETSVTGNPFEENNLLLARLDTLSRNEQLQEKIEAARDWDLIVCDEAHKMSASQSGNEVKYTKRFQLGRLLGGKTRHFLLLTATPHNGKETDFQLFLSLIDRDRFEGRFRGGVKTVDPSDIMCRRVKEEMLTFENEKLFPERKAYTTTYELSGEEARLYDSVTSYVVEEMNRADKVVQDGKRRGNISFALMILQRRLASSPLAIYNSLSRRRERLENKLKEAKLVLLGKGKEPQDTDELAEFDVENLDDAPESEIESKEELILGLATAAATIPELEAEIRTLASLESVAKNLRSSGNDKKWQELSSILDDPLMVDSSGNRRKLIVFTEPRDTVGYLAEKIKTRLGNPDSVAIIHGGLARDERRKIIESFNHDSETLVLVANDAAGEGVNLQRAHLMVNYDLPWNPNRLEQRFGRIHRIGQKEVCHLWNLVAINTREGAVYSSLLNKLETERQALGGRVYDVLGELFDSRPLKKILRDSIRYGESNEAIKYRAEIEDVVEHERIQKLLEERAFATECVDTTAVQRIREDVERAHVRRLQPHFISAFFLEAFCHLGGRATRRENGRWEVTRVPAEIRARDRLVGSGERVQHRYERICFDKQYRLDQPVASFVCPGHPLFNATVDSILERHRKLLKRGAVLVNEADEEESVHILYYLRHGIQDGRVRSDGEQIVISEQLQFVEVDMNKEPRGAGAAPYLDYRSATAEEVEALAGLLAELWLQEDSEHETLSYAIQNIVPQHVEDWRKRKLPMLDKVERAVEERLKKEIDHWEYQAQELKARESAGDRTGLSSLNAFQKAEELAVRLKRRKDTISRERQISPLPPTILGGGLVVSMGYLRKLGCLKSGLDAGVISSNVDQRHEKERLAMEVVMSAERHIGRTPRDVSDQRGIGYDIESRSEDGRLFFLEVKGKSRTDSLLTLSRNEINCARNEPAKFRLVIVEIENGKAGPPDYVSKFPFGEPDFGETIRSFSSSTLLEYSSTPH